MSYALSGSACNNVLFPSYTEPNNILSHCCRPYFLKWAEYSSRHSNGDYNTSETKLSQFANMWHMEYHHNILQRSAAKNQALASSLPASVSSMWQGGEGGASSSMWGAAGGGLTPSDPSFTGRAGGGASSSMGGAAGDGLNLSDPPFTSSGGGGASSSMGGATGDGSDLAATFGPELATAAHTFLQQQLGATHAAGSDAYVSDTGEGDGSFSPASSSQCFVGGNGVPWFDITSHTFFPPASSWEEVQQRANVLGGFQGRGQLPWCVYDCAIVKLRSQLVPAMHRLAEFQGVDDCASRLTKKGGIAVLYKELTRIADSVYNTRTDLGAIDFTGLAR